MQHSSEDITPSKYGKLSASLKPEGGEYTVTDESSGSSFPKHLDIPFKGSKEMSNGPWKLLSGSNVRHISSDASLFSTSLPVLPHEKLNINSKDHACQSIDDISCTPNKLDPLEDLEYQGSGTFLPDDEDELLSGIIDGFQIGLPNQMDDFEEYDVFGMEIESGLSNDMSKISLSEDGVGNGHYVLPNGVGTVAGEHPYGEHPSRTLFVRNINSNVEDLELRALFEQYGDIRALYTACKHRGFVMISYYDIRDARTAMKALQNKPLRRRKLDIHFSIPKDNPSDKDMNQGTLVVFNLDPSVSNDDLRQIFGAYGEVKEIRETPHKRHHKFIEFYDVRAAEAALRSLNRSDIAGKRIKLEPSRPGGARRNIMVNPSQEFELDDSLNFRHQLSSSVASSPPGGWPQYGSPIERSSFGNPLGFGSMSPSMGNNFSGLNSLLHPRLSNSPKIAPIGNGRASHLEHKFTDLNSNHNSPFPQSHSFPEGKLDPIETLSGSQFLWGSPVPNQQRNNSNPFTSNGQFQGLPYGNRPPVGTSHHLSRHHVGSAPSNVPMERHFGFFNESSERSVVNQMGFRGLGFGHNESNFGRVNGHFPGNLKMMPSSRLSPVFLDNNNYFPGLRPTGLEGFDHSWSQRVENSGNIMDNKKQFQLNLEKIINGEDKRTTLMIKNIPNKYTSKMLMAVIDENYRGTYDFLYLPIDFKNKCNVGYAFINMVSPSHIISFYKVFNGKRWEKFNSEKVASLAYARIQGKAALVAHFQNSSLMNEDKRCRPIVFHSDGSEASDQGYSPSNSLNIQAHQSYPEDSKGFPLGTSPHENPNNS